MQRVIKLYQDLANAWFLWSVTRGRHVTDWMDNVALALAILAGSTQPIRRHVLRLLLTSAGGLVGKIMAVCQIGCSKCADETANCHTCQQGFAQDQNGKVKSIAGCVKLGTQCLDGSYDTG